MPDVKLTNMANGGVSKKNQVIFEGISPGRAGCIFTSNSENKLTGYCLLWCNDIILVDTEQPEPQLYGWDLKEGKFKLVLTSLPPATEGVINPENVRVHRHHKACK